MITISAEVVSFRTEQIIPGEDSLSLIEVQYYYYIPYQLMCNCY